MPILVGPLLALVGIAVLLLLLPQPWHQLHLGRGDRFIDLDVYREAGVSLLHDRKVYEFLTAPPQNLPFTYPPTSALFSIVLALIPHAAIDVIWMLGCYVLVLGLTVVAFRDLLVRLGAQKAAVALPLLFLMASYLFPIRSVVHYGQVGLVLMALCVADCMVPAGRRRWPQGMLIGLAASLKLTPAVFIPYLWLSGRRRAAYVAAGSFCGFVALTWAILPGTSTDYWTDALFSSDRLGDNANTSNQALRGGILRLAAAHSTQTLLWAAALLVVGVVGFRRAAKASRAGHELAGVAIAGLLAVLLSPVAWIHHLVWCLLAIGVLLGAGLRRKDWVIAAIVAGWFSLTTPWFSHHKIYDHIPQSELSYQLPGTSTWIDFVGSPARELPAATHFRRLQGDGIYRPIPSSDRSYVDSCLGTTEQACLVLQHDEGELWLWRLGESSFLLAAVVLVFTLPVGTRRYEQSAAVLAP